MKVITLTRTRKPAVKATTDVVVIEREETDIEKMSLSEVVDLMADLNDRAVDVLRITPDAVKAVREGRKVNALWNHFLKDVPPNDEIRGIAKKMVVHVDLAEEYCEDYQWRHVAETARKMPV